MVIAILTFNLLSMLVTQAVASLRLGNILFRHDAAPHRRRSSMELEHCYGAKQVSNKLVDQPAPHQQLRRS